MPDPRAYGQRRRSGPVRDPAIPAAGRAQDRNPASDDLEFDRDPGAAGSGQMAGLPALRPALSGAAAPAAAPPGDGAPPQDPLDAIDAREEIEEEADVEAPDDGADASAPGSARADRIDRAARTRAAQLRDVSHQAGGGAQEDWRACDMGKLLAALRSSDAATRRKALQRLHIRWWHAPTESMKNTLEVGGAPPAAIADIPSVVQACQICRDWRRPNPRNILSFRLVRQCNEEVQFDLMFHVCRLEPDRGMLPILHLIDVCLRFSQGATSRKDELALTTTISRIWISIFAAMQTLTMDEETGMRCQTVSDWASANGMNLKFKAPQQRAWIVERHNDLLRRTIRTTEDQLINEDLWVPFEQVLAIVIFMRNRFHCGQRGVSIQWGIGTPTSHPHSP